jgi:hypothetical protein
MDKWEKAVERIFYLSESDKKKKILLMRLIDMALKSEAVCMCGEYKGNHFIDGGACLSGNGCKKFVLDRSKTK